MKKYKRIFTIVIDSLGIGAMEDSEQFGDKGVNTLGHIAERMEDFQIPNLRKLGIANLCSLSGLAPEEKPLGYRMVMREMSNGKDTMTGHWEMMGIHTTKPFQTFTDTGFPPELIKELEERTGPYGLVLVTGPTGSGKSTTLYATLGDVAKPEINIITVEDPVESPRRRSQ